MLHLESQKNRDICWTFSCLQVRSAVPNLFFTGVCLILSYKTFRDFDSTLPWIIFSNIYTFLLLYSSFCKVLTKYIWCHLNASTMETEKRSIILSQVFVILSVEGKIKIVTAQWWWSRTKEWSGRESKSLTAERVKLTGSRSALYI